MIRSLLIWGSLLVVSLSCNREEAAPQKIQISSFAIRDLGEFRLDDSLLFAANSDSIYFLKFLTQPTGASVYVSINQQAFKPQTEEWLQIDSTISSVKASATASVLATPLHDTKTITFGFGLQDLVGSPMLYPNPTKDSIAFEFSSESRGLVHIQLFNLQGIQLHGNYGLKTADTYHLKQSLHELAAGVYIIRVSYGDSFHLFRVFRQ